MNLNREVKKRTKVLKTGMKEQRIYKVLLKKCLITMLKKI